MERLKLRIGADASEPVLEDIWAIEDVVPLCGLGAIYGPPGSGKSIIALDMAICAAAGLNWQGKLVERCIVLYAALEGTKMFRNRVWAAARKLDIDPAALDTFATINAGLNLRALNDNGLNCDGSDICAIIDEMRERTRLKHVMVFIDTLNRSFGGGNENSPEDMGALIGNCGRIIDTTGGWVGLIHHSGKDVARGMRGHSSLDGAVDTELKVERKDDGRLLTVVKQRDGEDGEQFGFLVDSIEIGTTPNGKTVKAPFARYAAAGGIKDAPKAQGTNQRTLMASLEQLASEPGAARNPGGVGWPEPGRFIIVPVDALLDHAKGKLAGPEPGKPDKRHTNLTRALAARIDKGVLVQNADHVWNHRVPTEPNQEGRGTTPTIWRWRWWRGASPTRPQTLGPATTPSEKLGGASGSRRIC